MESCLHLNGVLWHCVISACTNDFLLFFFFPTFSLFSHSFHVLYCYLHTFLWISLLIVAALAFSLAATAQAPRIITGPAPVLPPAALRTPTPAGPTIMPLIRQIQTAVMPNGTPHPTAAIVPPGPEAGLIYTPYEYPYTLAPATSILEYPIEPSGVLGKIFARGWLENALLMLLLCLQGREVHGAQRKKIWSNKLISGISKLPRRAAQMVQLLNILNVFGIPECVCLIYINKFSENKIFMFVWY